MLYVCASPGLCNCPDLLKTNEIIVCSEMETSDQVFSFFGPFVKSCQGINLEAVPLESLGGTGLAGCFSVRQHAWDAPVCFPSGCVVVLCLRTQKPGRMFQRLTLSGCLWQTFFPAPLLLKQRMKYHILWF